MIRLSVTHTFRSPAMQKKVPSDYGIHYTVDDRNLKSSILGFWIVVPFLLGMLKYKSDAEDPDTKNISSQISRTH